MSRKVVSKERGVFEKEPGSNIWWIRFKANGVEHREKVGRCGDAIKLYPALRICRARHNPFPRSVCLRRDHRLSLDGGNNPEGSTVSKLYRANSQLVRKPPSTPRVLASLKTSLRSSSLRSAKARAMSKTQMSRANSCFTL